MKIEFKRISEPGDLEIIRNLYCTSFPPEERREFDGLTVLLSKKECAINQIVVQDFKVAGFCILWEFSAFIFIEHFAVFPELRGQGIGEEVLSVLREKFKVLILETELPLDELSQRRINFYKRNGFSLLERQYFQPSYGNNKPEVELKIMCTKADINDEKLNKYLLQIRKKVYQKIS